MRMSCNGCRVLRKGCSDSCTIRPCLQWIKTPESQANATVFLAKFYGRAGLLNLINSGHQHQRPAIFKSLLYEACGRIVNPIHGCAGLIWSGNWHLCQSAVESVLLGSPILQPSSDSAVGSVSPPLKACDIRHVSREDGTCKKRRARVSRTRSSNPKSTEFTPGGGESDSVSVETVEVSMVRYDSDLDLRLGLEPPSKCKRLDTCKVEMGVHSPA